MKGKIPSQISERELLRASPAYFINRVFRYVIAPHHYNILEHFNQSRTTLDLAPRGSGKSRVGNIGYASWCVCNQPNARLLVLSDTDGHAVRFLSTIKNVLGTSSLIEKYYGRIQGEQWSDHQITTSLRTDKSITEASITALGMYSGAVTSGHYSHIFADDLNNFANTRTQGMRERGKTWWKTTVLPTLLPGGEIRGLGTRYHYDDLYKMFIEELGYHLLIQPAVLDPGTSKERSLWEEGMPLHNKIINGVLVKGLIEIRDGTPGGADSGIGSLIFNLQYMNDTSLQESGVIFRYDWFNFYEDLPSGLKVYQGIDLAISKKDTADFFVILTLGINTLGNVYILDIFRKRGVTFNDQRALVIKKAKEWKPIRIGIETNAYQAVLAEEVKRLTLLPIMEIPTSKDKVLRAQMRSGLVESRRVFVRSRMHDFVSELTMFDADAEFDDQFDAFDFALTVAESGQVEVVPSEYYVPEFDLPGEYS